VVQVNCKDLFRCLDSLVLALTNLGLVNLKSNVAKSKDELKFTDPRFLRRCFSWLPINAYGIFAMVEVDNENLISHIEIIVFFTNPMPL
jgi:hypothetical protein